MDLFDLQAKIGIDTAEYEKGVKSAAKSGEQLKDSMDDLKESTDKVNDGFTVAKGVLSNLVSGGITRAFDAFTNLASTIVNLDGATEEHRIAMGRLNTAYESAGYSADVAKQAYTAFYGIIGDTDTATEASQLLSRLARSAEDVATWTDIAAGVSGTFGDSLPIETLIEAANETSRTGVVVGTLADALNWATREGETFGVQLKENTEANKEWNQAILEAQSAEDYFNLALQECTSEAERNQLIMDTLSGTYSDASAAFYENNAALVESRENQVSMQDSLSRLGGAIGTIKTALMTELTPSLAAAAESAAAFVESVDIDSLLQNGKEAISLITGVASAFATWKIISSVTAAVSTLTAAIASAGGLTAALGAVVSAINPVTAVLSVLAGAFSVAYTQSETFRDTVNAAVKSMYDYCSGLLADLSNTIANLWSTITTGTNPNDVRNNPEWLAAQARNGNTQAAAQLKKIQSGSQAAALQAQADADRAVDWEAVADYNARKSVAITTNYTAALGNAATVSKKAVAETVAATKKAVEEEKSLFDLLQESFSATTDTLESKTDIVALEFDIWESSMGDTVTESEKLQKQLESLTAQQELQKQAVDAARDAYDQIVAKYGETSDEALSFQKTLLQEVSAYQDLQNEIDETTAAINSNSAEIDRLKTVQSLSAQEFEVWSGKMEESATEAELLAGQLASLTEQNEYQTQVVQLAQEAYQAMCEQYGENSEEALAYKETLLQEILTQQQLQGEIDETTAALNNARNAQLQFQAAAQNALTATDNFGGAISTLGSATSDFGELIGNQTVSDVGSYISRIGNSITTTISMISAVVNLIKTLQALGTALQTLSTASSVISGLGSILGIGGAAAAGTAAAGAAAAGGAAAAAGGAVAASGGMLLPIIGGVALAGLGIYGISKLVSSSKKKSETTYTAKNSRSVTVVQNINTTSKNAAAMMREARYQQERAVLMGV